MSGNLLTFAFLAPKPRQGIQEMSDRGSGGGGGFVFPPGVCRSVCLSLVNVLMWSCLEIAFSPLGSDLYYRKRRGT